MLSNNITDWFDKYNSHFTRELNGYSNPPFGPYISTLPLLTNDGSIMDLGSGNGMLLKFLMDFSDKKIVPYGIDINTVSIEEAIKLFPEYANNFNVCNIKNYSFGESLYDTVITNPFYFELEWITKLCINMLKPKGRLIYRVHTDVLRNNNINSLSEITLFNDLGFKVSNGIGLQFAVYDAL